jgi:hypothetical protein
MLEACFLEILVECPRPFLEFPKQIILIPSYQSHILSRSMTDSADIKLSK